MYFYKIMFFVPGFSKLTPVSIFPNRYNGGLCYKIFSTLTIHL